MFYLMFYGKIYADEYEDKKLGYNLSIKKVKIGGGLIFVNFSRNENNYHKALIIR